MEQLGIIRQNSDALPSHKAFSVSPLPNASDKKVHQIVQTRPVPVQSSARAETQTLAPVVGFHNRQIDKRLGDGQVYKSWWAAWQTEHSFRASTEEEIPSLQFCYTASMLLIHLYSPSS